LAVRLLEQGWKSCQANEARHERGELLNWFERKSETPPTPQQIHKLDDASVDRLYHRSLHEDAQQFRRGPAVLA
jgi:hypothetical protein